MNPQAILIAIVASTIIATVIILLNKLGPKKNTERNIDLNGVFRANKLVGLSDCEEVVSDLNGRRHLTRRKKEVYPSIISLSKDQLILKVHESLTLKDLRSSSRSLGADLYRLGFLKTQNLFISSADRPDTYSLKCLSDDEVILTQLLRKSGLVKKDNSGEEVWPEIQINDKGVIQIKSYLLNLAEVEKATPDFNQLGRTYEFVEQEGSIFKISPIGAFEQFLSKGESVLSKSVEYIDKYVEPNKNKEPRWFLGINQFTGEEVWRDLIDTPALVVAGGSGAGKTETVKSILFNLVATHPNTKIYAYDGKASTSWISIANNLSPFRLAVPAEGSVAREAFFLVDQVYREYLKRIELFKKVNADNVITYEKKTGTKLERILLLLEEYPVFANELNFEKTHSQEGSGAYKLKRLIQESRSYGFAYIFLTQTANGSTLPAILLNNMLVIAHKSSEIVAEYFGLPLQTLPTGSYYIKTDAGKILCRNHYLGAGNDTFDKLLKIANVKPCTQKMEIDPNFIQVTELEKERSEFAPMLKSALIRQGFEIDSWDNSNYSSVAGIATYENFVVRIAFLKKDELSALQIKSINSDDCTHLLVLCEFAIDEKKETELVKRAQAFEFGSNKAIFVTDTVWKRLIYQALEGEPKKTIYQFIKARTELITLIEPSKKSEQESEKEPNIQEPESLITIERLTAVKNLKGKGEVSKRKKGKLFESFVAGLFVKKGYEVIWDSDLKVQKYTFEQKGDGDGGLDLVARKGDELILIQAKNWTWDVDNSAVQQILAAKATMEGLRTEKVTKLIVVATSDFTQPALNQAKAAGVELWNHARLIQEVKEYGTEKRSKGRPKKVA